MLEYRILYKNYKGIEVIKIENAPKAALSKAAEDKAFTINKDGSIVTTINHLPKLQLWAGEITELPEVKPEVKPEQPVQEKPIIDAVVYSFPFSENGELKGGRFGIKTRLEKATWALVAKWAEYLTIAQAEEDQEDGITWARPGWNYKTEAIRILIRNGFKVRMISDEKEIILTDAATVGKDVRKLL